MCLVCQLQVPDYQRDMGDIVWRDQNEVSHTEQGYINKNLLKLIMLILEIILCSDIRCIVSQEQVQNVFKRVRFIILYKYPNLFFLNLIVNLLNSLPQFLFHYAKAHNSEGSVKHEVRQLYLLLNVKCAPFVSNQILFVYSKQFYLIETVNYGMLGK